MITSKDNTKKTYLISLAGCGNFGFAYYSSKLFARLGYKVMSVDNTFGHEMFRVMSKDEDVSVAEAENLVCLCDIALSPEPFSAVDFVVVWHGMDIDDQIWNMSDLRVVVTDYDPFHVEELSTALEDIGNEAHTVFINKSTGKIKEKDIIKKLGLAKDVYVDIGHQVVDLEESDAASFQALEYNYLQSLKGFSSAYRDVVTDIVGYFIGGKDAKKNIAKIIAKVS